MKQKHTARLVRIDGGPGGWWGVFRKVDNPDYPNGVLVCTVCNHEPHFEPAEIARRIADALNEEAAK